MIMNRIWAMPNKDTCTVKPIKELVERYLRNSVVSVDPFAKDSMLCTYRNDLNRETKAEYHLTALEFLTLMERLHVSPDLALFDPPYSLEQTKRSYEGVGKEFTHWDSQHAVRWGEEKDVIKRIQPVGGIVIHMGWHTNGMGIGRDYEPLELLVVAHGGAHNDTLVLVERKVK